MHLFPRLQKRGPIEASSWSSSPAAASRTFPRLQKRGPIEARSPGWPGMPSSSFPRLQKRGPIEAASVARHYCRHGACFHAYKSAAPLKRGERSNRLLAAGRFHAYKSVAPLKQEFAPMVTSSIGEFPRLQKRVPIEAGICADGHVVNRRVSTLTKACPH